MKEIIVTDQFKNDITSAVGKVYQDQSGRIILKINKKVFDMNPQIMIGGTVIHKDDNNVEMHIQTFGSFVKHV